MLRRFNACITHLPKILRHPTILDSYNETAKKNKKRDEIEIRLIVNNSQLCNHVDIINNLLSGESFSLSTILASSALTIP